MMLTVAYQTKTNSRAAISHSQKHIGSSPAQASFDSKQATSYYPGNSFINRKCAHCEEEEKQLQRKESNGNAAEVPAIVHDVINSTGGRYLNNDTRSYMESRFNYDFSDVKIHDNDLAAKSADSINALAYTSGNNIVFNSGKYQPTSSESKRLLAHELTHVVQQTKGYKSVQRQTTAPDIPPPMPCIEVRGPGHPSGTHFLFTHDSDTINPLDIPVVRSFASAWISGGSSDEVFIDGYASTDGPKPLNWNLSCRRAEAVKGELVTNGVNAAKITTFAHGESTEFSPTRLSPNRRAILSSVRLPSPAPEENVPVCGPQPPAPVGGAAPFLINPGIASRSSCRGACGSDCPATCTPQPDVVLCLNDSTGTCHYTYTYRSVVECGSHRGCREHDDCYDRCAVGGETNILGPCHRGCDIDCIRDFSFSECNSWRTGGGPFDRRILFSNAPAVTGPFPGPCTP